MGKKTISINLFDPKSIDKAINEVNKFASDYEKKVDTCKKMLAKTFSEYATENIANCWYDDYVDIGEDTPAFSMRTPNCYCVTDEVDDKIVVTGTGDFSLYDGSTILVWVEFGAGMYHNGIMNIGGNPNPLWEETGLKGIGQYGYRQGRFPVWSAPYGLSRGTLAQMPLYNALIATEQDAEKLIKEIFK